MRVLHGGGHRARVLLPAGPHLHQAHQEGHRQPRRGVIGTSCIHVYTKAWLLAYIEVDEIEDMKKYAKCFETFYREILLRLHLPKPLIISNM